MTKNKCEDCGNCCRETEMLLSARDIALIMKNGRRSLKPIDFVRKTDIKLFQLKNSNGYCVFFDLNTSTCKIYESRPQGCRFYPLTLDIDTKMCVLDQDCPRPELFYPNSNTRISTCKNLITFLEDQILFTKLR
ncbi:MAG: YkgJ family cysteine cluster protein [Promethearchaeota archaeon]|jgi:Fe-S-cluster containining protein